MTDYTGTTVTVTQEDIDQGRVITCRPLPPRSQNCPVTLAVKRATGEVQVASCQSYIVIGDVTSYAMYEVPVEVFRFIDAYDKDAPVEPFEFQLGEVVCPRTQ